MDGTTQDRQKVIATNVGASFKIKVWEDRSRGEAWTPLYDEDQFVLLDDDYEETSTYNAGMRVLEFEALRPGTFEIVFEKRLGWKFTAENRKRFQVRVEN